MRKLILPLVVALLYSSVSGYSQAVCSGAFTIALNSTCNNFLMSQPLATGDPLLVASGGCGGLTADRRVTWFKFIATTTNLNTFQIDVRNAAGTSHVGSRLEIAFYANNGNAGLGACPTNDNSFATIDGLSAVNCYTNGTGLWSSPIPLTIGNTYYLRIYSDLNNNGTNYNINICTTPLNETALGSIGSTCSPINYPTTSGIGQNFSPLINGITNRCGGTNDRSVNWFKFTPTTSACTIFKIFTGVPTEVAFFDPASGLVPGSTICLADGDGIWAPALPYAFVPGNDYYLRIYTNTNSPATNINICATRYTPPNDLCSSATHIDNTGILDNNVCATGSVANGGTEPAWITSNSVNLLCAPILQNTAWYYFVVNNNLLPTTVSVSGVNCDNFGSGTPNIQLGLLQGPSNMASCVTTSGSLFPPPSTPTHCFATSASSFGFTVPASPTIPNGTKMYIAVDGTSGANCSYVISTGNAIPIPVRLKYFTGWKQAQTNQLRWITSWETNNKNFEIERSYDGTNFTYIGRVDGALNSTSDIQYKFDDNNPPFLAYYRLKQIDIDGKFEYSNVIMIKRDNSKPVFNVAFANPVHNSSLITINMEKPGIAILRIVDVAGRDLSTQEISCGPGNNTVLKDYSRLSSGNYYLIVTQGENRIVKPFIKQ